MTSTPYYKIIYLFLSIIFVYFGYENYAEKKINNVYFKKDEHENQILNYVFENMNNIENKKNGVIDIDQFSKILINASILYDEQNKNTDNSVQQKNKSEKKFIKILQDINRNDKKLLNQQRKKRKNYKNRIPILKPFKHFQNCQTNSTDYKYDGSSIFLDWNPINIESDLTDVTDFNNIEFLNNSEKNFSVNIKMVEDYTLFLKEKCRIEFEFFYINKYNRTSSVVLTVPQNSSLIDYVQKLFDKKVSETENLLPIFENLEKSNDFYLRKNKDFLKLNPNTKEFLIVGLPGLDESLKNKITVGKTQYTNKTNINGTSLFLLPFVFENDRIQLLRYIYENFKGVFYSSFDEFEDWVGIKINDEFDFYNKISRFFNTNAKYKITYDFIVENKLKEKAEEKQKS